MKSSYEPLDLTKAFDTVSHDILLYKMKAYGFKSQTVNWYRSYLSGRTQVTCVNGQTSNELRVKTGVPQGSILGPFLFCVYVNDLCAHLQHANGFLYADDSALLVSGTDIMSISTTLNMELAQLSRWFSVNKLSINIGKTRSMLFRSKHKYKHNTELLIMHEQEEVIQVKEFKYLGMMVDEYLDFTPHVNRVCSKVNQRTGLLWRVRNCIGKELAIDLYTSLIDPHFQYCAFLYDSCQLAQKRKLQICQNKALRAVLKVGNRFSSTALHADSGINWLGTSRAKSTCIEIYKIVQGNCSPNMAKIIHVVPAKRALRSNNKIQVSRLESRTKFGEGNFCHRGVKYWDMLDPEIQGSKTLGTFKRRIKKCGAFDSAMFTHFKNVHYL